MLKKTIIALSIATLATNTYAWKVVYDPTQASNAIKQITEAKNQLEQLKAQVQQMKNVYQSLNGTRGIVNTLEDPSIISKLPQKYQDLYLGIKNSKNSKWQDLYELSINGKASKNTTDENLKEAYEHSLKTHAEEINKSFEYQHKRIKNLEKFANQISTTKDPKEIADLQARISAEQAGLEIDRAIFELIKESTEMREKALRQHASNKWRESLRKPFVMPDIHVDIKKPFSD